MHESTWGWWHQLPWGWWLLICAGVVIAVGFAAYAAFLLAITRSAVARERPREDRGRDGRGAQHPPHAAATT